MKKLTTNANIELVAEQTGYTPSNQTSDYSGVKAAYAWLAAQKKTQTYSNFLLKPTIRKWGLCYLDSNDIAIAAEMLGLLDKKYYDQKQLVRLSISKKFLTPQVAPQDVIPDYGTSPSYGN